MGTWAEDLNERVNHARTGSVEQLLAAERDATIKATLGLVADMVTISDMFGPGLAQRIRELDEDAAVMRGYDARG